MLKIRSMVTKEQWEKLEVLQAERMRGIKDKARRFMGGDEAATAPCAACAAGPLAPSGRPVSSRTPVLRGAAPTRESAAYRPGSRRPRR